MMKSDISFKITKKAVKNIKTFIYRDKSFQFDFNLLKENSIYLHKNRSLFKDKEKIDLLSENIEKAVELSDDVITSFIDCCEGSGCLINEANVIPLQFLAYRFEVPELIDVTNKFISDNFSQLVLKSISFKNNFNNIDNEEWLIKYSDCSKEEFAIATNLIKYLDGDDLFIFPISFIERLFGHFFSQPNSVNLIKKLPKFTDFLFNCLDHYGKGASALFSYVDFESQSFDIVDRLLKDYSNVFDFNMINSTLLKTTYQLTSEMTKIKLEYSNSMKKMEELFNGQREELNSITEKYLKKEEEEDKRTKEREEIFKQQIIKLKEENENLKKIFFENLSEMKKRTEEVINFDEVQGFHKLVRESMRLDAFNEISVESQKFFIKNVIKNAIQFDDDNESRCLAQKIIALKEFYESVSKIENKSVDSSELIDFISNQINNLFIDFKLVENLFHEKILQKALTNLTNCIDNITIEIKYPCDDFNEMFSILSEMAKQVNDDKENQKTVKNANLNEDKDEPFKVILIISEINSFINTFNSFVQDMRLKLGDNEIDNHYYLINVELSSSITRIEDGAFSGCTKLMKIKIPSSVTSIGSQAFYNRTSLKQVIIEAQVASIENSTFYNCSSLQEVVIPESVNSIGSSVFQNCSSLQKISIPKSVTTIQNSVFQNCSSLQKITIPESVTSIGSSVFQNCSSLQEISIPKSVTKIGSNAFHSCSSLRKVIIPPSITSIGSNAFYNCNNIREVECDPYKISLTSLFPNNSSITNLTIKTTKNSICNNNLYNLSNLNQIIISSPITTIGDNSFYNISQLQSITIPESVTTIQNSAFQDCSSLQEITIPKSVTSIGSSVFQDCSSLQKITIPESVTSIGSSVFQDCSSLKEISIPKSVTSIGSSVFQECSSLQKITIPESVTSIGSSVFQDCSSLKEISIPKSVTTIGNNAFYSCSSLKKVIIPPSVTSIGSDAFYDCYNIREVECDPYKISLTTVFSNYSSITNLTINTSSSTLTDIGISNLSSLNQITISSPVTTIGDEAFSNCSNLQQITIPESVKTIGNNSFYNCSSLHQINIPKQIQSIGSMTFYGCSSLIDVDIPSTAIVAKDAFMAGFSNKSQPSKKKAPAKKKRQLKKNKKQFNKNSTTVNSDDQFESD